MREWLPELLAVPLYPLLSWQGRQTRKRVPRLPEPADEAHGTVGRGDGTPISLLMMGESPVAGVGVESHAFGIGAATAQALSTRFDRPVAWQSLGINGITVAQALVELIPALPPSPVDIVCIAFGVNDSTGFRSHARWRNDMQALVEVVRSRAHPKLILLSGVPPLAAFPALPCPLRQILGMKAASLDRALAHMAMDSNDVLHVPLPSTLTNAGYMASDGYHPSADGCAYWASLLATAVPDNFRKP